MVTPSLPLILSVPTVAPNAGGLWRLYPITGNTSMQGKPGGGFVIEENTAQAGDFSSVRYVMRFLSNANREDTTQGTYPNYGRPYRNDADFYLPVQNIGVASDNNLRMGEGANAPLDVGPVYTAGRDVEAPPGSYLAGWYAGGRAYGSQWIDTTYASLVARVVSNDPQNPDGEWVLCSAGPQPTNAGNYPRFAIGKGFRSFDRPSLGENSSHVQISAADAFLNQETMNAGESCPVAGSIVGFNGSGYATNVFDNAATFAPVYRSSPLLVVVGGKCPMNISTPPGKYIRAYRTSSGGIGIESADTPNDKTLGRVRRWLGSSQVEMIRS